MTLGINHEYMSVLLNGVYLNSVQLTYTKVLPKLEFKKLDIQKGAVY